MCVPATLTMASRSSRVLNSAFKIRDPLLRGGHPWFDLLPSSLDCGQSALDFQGSVRVPSVIKKKQHATGDERDHADLQRIALALSLFQNLLVKEVEMKCHRSLGSEVFECRPAGDVERDKFMGEGLSLRRGEGHFTCLQRIPNFTRQSEVVAQHLENGLDAG